MISNNRTIKDHCKNVDALEHKTLGEYIELLIRNLEKNATRINHGRYYTQFLVSEYRNTYFTYHFYIILCKIFTKIIPTLKKFQRDQN